MNDCTVCVDVPTCYIRKIRADEYTPITLLHATKAIGVLESVSAEFGRSRYSIVLVQEYARLIQRDGVISMSYPKKGSLKNEADFQTQCVYKTDKTFLELLKDIADEHAEHNIADLLGIPFPSGGIGYLSFEYASYCDAFRFSKQCNSLKRPEALFIIPHIFIVFDHVEEMLYLVALTYCSTMFDGILDDNVSLSSRIDKVVDDISKGDRMSSVSVHSTIETRPDDKSHYCDMVRTIQNRIVDGYLLQAVPSRRVKVQSSLSPLEAYRLLRHHNPSPYLFYLDCGNYSLIGSSPESHVKSVHGEVIVTPIAGTRRRGRGSAEDFALARELINDPKERAEHLMLVDLARNDISRVCESASVVVHKMFEVKYFAKVMHIVSEVRGSLREGNTGIDALAVTFPAGTVSGAPKIQLVYEISKLERERRGFYAGVVGYVAPGGDVDTCITLRSMLYQDGCFYLQAGAGVVFDSVPEREFEETEEKISALIRALGIEVT